ncbi:MAG: hypothetical protein QNK23_11975 [Crocinitomicaceae bacterium]|nr:hypothetical protein [Crocinitomicaceae bacterium]
MINQLLLFIAFIPMSLVAQDTVYVKCPEDSDYTAYYLDSTWTYESVEEVHLVTRSDCKYFRGSMVDNQPWKGMMSAFDEYDILLYIRHWDDGKLKPACCDCDE